VGGLAAPRHEAWERQARRPFQAFRRVSSWVAFFDVAKDSGPCGLGNVATGAIPLNGQVGVSSPFYFNFNGINVETVGHVEHWLDSGQRSVVRGLHHILTHFEEVGPLGQRGRNRVQV